jgi:hypothetical protein
MPTQSQFVRWQSDGAEQALYGPLCQPTSHFISQLTRVRSLRILGSQRQPPISKRTHPEKKWAAGTNESNAKGQSFQTISLPTGGSHKRHAGGICESQGGPRIERPGEMDSLAGALVLDLQDYNPGAA